MYFVSAVILMRMNLPVEYRLILTEVLGNLEFSFYHRWFDAIFLVRGFVLRETQELSVRQLSSVNLFCVQASSLASLAFVYLTQLKASEKRLG
jgi:hypothetical protein